MDWLWHYWTVPGCTDEEHLAEVMQGQARHFAGPYRFELVPNSSHFLQREQPQAVTKLVLDCFAQQ
ncbi:MAG TPA: alpha/beta hydrolase [Streptosporangiaceae bacterium]|nr:alpha/beta hydrolase [Streptosporangiaceae bacterium]